MSDTDRDSNHFRGKSDMEDSCARHSLVDSTIDLTEIDHRDITDELGYLAPSTQD